MPQPLERHAFVAILAAIHSNAVRRFKWNELNRVHKRAAIVEHRNAITPKKVRTIPLTVNRSERRWLASETRSSS